MGNETGIVVQGTDNRVWIGQADGSGNVIADNNTGIRLRGGASGVLVAGNFIGVHSNGQAMGNGRGIALSEFSLVKLRSTQRRAKSNIVSVSRLTRPMPPTR